VRLRIEDIKEKGLTLDFVEDPSEYPVLSEMAKKGEGDFRTEVRTHVRAQRIGDLVEIDGRVETTARLACSRCLQDFEKPLSGGFSLAFVRELPAVHDEEGGEEVEVSAEEMGLVLFEGDEIDLKDTVQEQVVLALPVRPLCSNQCPGLCAKCGADLKHGECGCDRVSGSLKFAALKDFKVNKDRN